MNTNMKGLWKQLSLLLVLAMLLSGIQPCHIQAASRKYVKSLSLSRKSLTIKKGKSKTIRYQIRVKGKASKKISVKPSNAKVKVTVKKGKIKITAKKTGNCNITISTKARNRKGKKINKRIWIKVVSGNASSEGSSGNRDVGNHSSSRTAVPDYPSVSGGNIAKRTSRPASTRKPSPDETTAPGVKVTSDPGIGSDVEVSRSEWITALMQLTGYQEQKELFDYHDDGTVSYSFTDISGHSDAGLLETAVKYGIIPKSGEKFYPNAAADREFLAYTSVRAIGFAAEDINSSFSDQADLQHTEEDAVAVQIGLLKTKNNLFCPDQAVSWTEKQAAEKVLAEIMKGREINENHEDVIVYKQDVVADEHATNYMVNEQDGEYTVVLPAGTAFDNVSAGDSIVLPQTEEYPEGMALEVHDNSLSVNGTVRVISGIAPDEITDIVDSVDIEGLAEPIPGEATAVEGVATVTVTQGKKSAAKRNGIRGKSIEGSIGLENQTKFAYTVEELGTTVSFYLSELQYKIDFNKKGVKELYIGLPNVFALETDFKASKKFSKKVGDIPIQLHAGFSANIEVFLEAEIGGEVSVDFKLSNNIGVQYYNGMFQLQKGFESGLDVMVDADLDAGVKLQLGLYWMKGIREIFSKEDPRPIYNIYTKWGLHGDATLHIRNDQYTSYQNLACVDLEYYLYGNVGVGDGSFLGEAFQLKKIWWIFDEKNSPLKKTIHIENGKIIAACTYQKSDTPFEDYLKNYEFLCDDNTVHETYGYYDTEHELFVQSDLDGIEKPFSYEIADYDSDGSNELLIANMGHGYNDYNDNGMEDDDEGFSTINLQMYELENGSVKLQAEKLCVVQDTWSSWYYHNIPAFETTGDGWTEIYRYKQNGEQIVAVEYNDVEAFYDRVAFIFMAVKYNGKQWIDVGEITFDETFEENLEEYQNKFSAIGLNVNCEEMLLTGTHVMDYIDDSIFIGRSKSETFSNDMWFNPNVLYKIGSIRFAKQ